MPVQPSWQVVLETDLRRGLKRMSFDRTTRKRCLERMSFYRTTCRGTSVRCTGTGGRRGTSVRCAGTGVRQGIVVRCTGTGGRQESVVRCTGTVRGSVVRCTGRADVVGASCDYAVGRTSKKRRVECRAEIVSSTSLRTCKFLHPGTVRLLSFRLVLHRRLDFRDWAFETELFEAAALEVNLD